jgi:uncharacterized protein (DUF1015 family)
MAEIRPFRAWRYNPDKFESIEELTSPLFDVISPRQRQALYDHPYNSIHLSVPLGSEPPENARDTMLRWKLNNVILQDEIPGIYVYYQYFSLAGSDHQHIRKGFIANLRLYDWDEKAVLRHEATMPYSVKDRTEILHYTQMNVSPTHGLFTDTRREIEGYLDDAMKHPIYSAEDYQGVKDVMSVIHDRDIIVRIMEILKDKQIILADGHHRYEGSLHYRNQMIKENPRHTGMEGYNYHMMYFTNTESDDLRVLPTHRIFQNTGLSESQLLEMLDDDFYIKPIQNGVDVNDVILGKKWTFGLLIGENAYKIKLKPEKIDEILWNIPEQVKHLDITVLHYFLIEKRLKIPRVEQPDTDKVKFERNFTECLKEVLKGEAEFAVITREISIETVKEVCYSGHTMPQKTTYFYPKVICGFLFSSIKDDEFTSRLDSSF